MKCVIIGGSAGSLKVILNLLPQLSPVLSIPVVVVLHRLSHSTSSLEGLLAARTSLRVKEAEDKDQLTASTIYIAPADYHLLIEKDLSVSLDVSEKVLFSRPSIDVALQSAAEAFGAGLLAVLLSGANHDGAEGLKEVKDAGGMVAIQDPSQADNGVMPEAALKLVKPDYVLSDGQLSSVINAWANA